MQDGFVILARVKHTNDPHFGLFNGKRYDHAALVVRNVKAWPYVIAADRTLKGILENVRSG